MSLAMPGYLAAAAAAAAVAAGAVAVILVLHWGSVGHRQRLQHLGGHGLAELFLFVDPGLFVLANALALLLLPLLVYLLTLNFAAAVLACLLVLVCPGMIYRRLRARRLAGLQQQLPDAISALAAAVRSGLSLGQALEQIPRYQPAPIAQEFALALREQRLGVPLDEALRRLAERTASRDFALFVATVLIARELGGSVADALERLGASVRRRLVMEERIRALTAQGRLQGVVMALLPLLLGVVLFAMDPGRMQELFRSPLGWAVVGVVTGLELAGWLLIRRIVRIDV